MIAYSTFKGSCCLLIISGRGCIILRTMLRTGLTDSVRFVEETPMAEKLDEVSGGQRILGRSKSQE